MPWREYVDPDTGEVWRTDAPVGGDDSSYNYLPGGIPPTPPAAVRPTVGFGGGGQYAGGTYGLSEAAQAQQLALLVRKLEELELPTLDLQRRNQLLQEIQQLTAATGYVDRNLWSRLQGGGGQALPAGSYNTKNGVKTIQQMRAEVVGASGGMQEWRDAPDERIIAEYGRMTGQPVNQTAPGGGQGGGSSVRQQMMDWDQAFHTRNNGAAPTAEQRAQRLAQITGMTPDQAMAMEQRRTQWMQLTGGSGEQGIGQYYPSDAEFDSWQQQIAPQRTLDRQRFEDTLGENRRQFDASQRQQGQQFWGGLLASKSGPRDYWTYNMMQANVPESARWGDMRSLANATPYSGAMTPGNNSWEQTFADWMRQQRSGATDTGQPPSGGGQHEYAGGERLAGGSGYTGQAAAAGDQQPTPMPVTGLGNTTPGAPTRQNNPPDNSGDWESANFSDSSLGNPQPGMDYSQAFEQGWRNRRTGETRRARTSPYEAYEQGGRQGGAEPDQRSQQMGQPYQADPRQSQEQATLAQRYQQMVQAYQTGPSALQQQGNPQNRGTAAPQTGVLPGEPNGLDWRGTFTQPNTLDPRTWNRMRESQRDMLGGQWSSFGVDPRDAEQQMRRSWAGGQANTRTRWM